MADNPKNPVDLSKLTDITKKIDVKGIISNVKSMIGMGAPVIPESAKDNPVGFRLSNLTSNLKALEETNGLQAQLIGKIGAELGALYKELQEKAGPDAAPTPAPKKTESAPKPTPEKKPEVPAEPPKPEEEK